MIVKGEIHYGDIVLANCDPSVGHEMRSIHPVLVIQSEKQLKISNVVTVVPLTSKLKNNIEDDIIIRTNDANKLQDDSIIKVRAIGSFDYIRFIHRIGHADKETLEKIKQYLKKHFDI